jgi:acetoin utilization deacetylase AcuC-like enzyme
VSAVTISHPSHIRHASPGHPERPERIAAFLSGVLGEPLLAARATEAPLAPRAALERVHDAGYLDIVLAERPETVHADPDTYIAPGTPDAAVRAAGAAIAAVDAVVAGGIAIAAMRPPGHHCLPQRPMGFCVLANIAIAVRHAQAAHGVGRVAVVDWDVHHGNGTQAVFWDDPSVLAVSLHQWPHYPGTGAADERGGPGAAGATLNVPLPAGTGHDAYLARFRAEVLPAVAAFRPELVVVACGLDAHRDDPLGDLELEDATFGQLVRDVRGLCRALGAPEPALVLEGGYDLHALEASGAEIARAYGASVI